jgi:predicted DNA-binding protein (MmcQ/YjbR family)
MAHYLDWLRQFCLSLPRTTEDVQWQHDLLFRIAGKIYCVANLEPALSPGKVAFKCSPEKFAELVEIEGIVPAPYMARNHWVSLTEMNALRQSEVKELVHNSYRLVLERLPKKTQAEITGANSATKSSPSKRKPVAKRRK